MSPEPMIVQHDDRFYRRRRWERTERSEPTSASRTGSKYPNRCDWRCSHDREWYMASLKQFRLTLSRGNICSADAVQGLPSGT